MNKLQNQLSKIRLLALDSDGVLTDGGVYVFEDGRQFRRFSIKDGMGIRLLLDEGYVIAIISSSTNEAVVERAKGLGVEEIHLGVENKLEIINKLVKKYSLELDSVAFMGDDIVDLPVLKKVGFSCSPSDALNLVKECVHYVTDACGGKGAVREICDIILTNYLNDEE